MAEDSVAEDSRTVTNWAATFSCTPSRYAEPASVAEVQAIMREVAARGGVVRAVGACHSPNDCAMAQGAHSVALSLRRMGAVRSIDAASGVVVCGGGATLHALNAACAAAGLALPNLGSISDQTIAGALATGTHGTGLRQGVMATWVLALELVTGSGEVLQLSAATDARAFAAAQCSLGVLGVVTAVTLQAVPAFDLHVEERPAVWGEVLSSLPQRAASAPFYRFWWLPHTERVWEWRAHPRAPAPAAAAAVHGSGGLLGALRAAYAWVWGMGIGHHALQALLRVAQWAPGLVPGINALYAFLFFRVPRSHTAPSYAAFNFDCLFKQCVWRPRQGLPLSRWRWPSPLPPHLTPPASPPAPPPRRPGLSLSGPSPWRPCRRRWRGCGRSLRATACARTSPWRCASLRATTSRSPPRAGA